MSQTDTETSTKRPIVNFSRPRALGRALTAPSDASVNPWKPANPEPATVISIEAFHQPSRDDDKYPAEPCFSLDSDLDDDEQQSDAPDPPPTVFELASPDAPVARPASPPPPTSTTAPTLPDPGPRPHSSSSSSSTPAAPQTSRRRSTSGSDNLSARARPTPLPLPTTTTTPRGILKHTTVEQHSERASSSSTGESARSHHTASETGSSNGDGKKWTSSDADTSMLSAEQIARLRRKGVNPALYVEMKRARKGKSFVGRLTGNAYVS